MKHSKIKNRIAVITVILLILVAYSFRLVDILNGTEHREFTIIRSVIYIFLFTAWGIFVSGRIIQKQVRRFSSYVAVLIVFWITIRTIKYSFIVNADFTRAIWYLYYIPMIFIPLLALIVSMSLGKAEDYRLPKKTILLLIPAFIILLVVLTNDFHQLVFSFPSDALVYRDTDYKHGIFYYFILAWAVLCIAATCVIIVVKCRIPGKKKLIIMPLIPIFALAIYGFLYLAELPVIKLFLNDLTVVFCLLITATFESFMHCGLIQSNTHYSELFRLSDISAKIFDIDFNEMLSANNSEPISKSIVKQAVAEPVLLEDGFRLSGHPLKNGFVVWSEDVSELAEVLDELENAREDLNEETALLRESYNTARHIRHLEEQNRLYDEIHRQTANQIVLLAELIEKFDSESNEEEKLRLLRKMTVIGVYIKRRSNLVFIGEQSPVLDEREIKLCFEETMNNLELSGATCGCYINLGGSVLLSEATAIYDFYEMVAEAAYDSLSSLLIRIYKSAGDTVISIGVVSEADLSMLVSSQVSLLQDEEGVCSITLRIPEGGKRQ